MEQESTRVTIRLAKGKEQVYQDFKDLVIDELHSDVCYVMTMLMEDFTKTMRELPEPTKMTLLQQNITINKGPANYYYYAKKPRRKKTLKLKPAYPTCEINSCNQPAIHRFTYNDGISHDYCKIHNTRAPPNYLTYQKIEPHKTELKEKMQPQLKDDSMTNVTGEGGLWGRFVGWVKRKFK